MSHCRCERFRDGGPLEPNASEFCVAHSFKKSLEQYVARETGDSHHATSFMSQRPRHVERLVEGTRQSLNATVLVSGCGCDYRSHGAMLP